MAKMKKIVQLIQEPKYLDIEVYSFSLTIDGRYIVTFYISAYENTKIVFVARNWQEITMTTSWEDEEDGQDQLLDIDENSIDQEMIELFTTVVWKALNFSLGWDKKCWPFALKTLVNRSGPDFDDARQEAVSKSGLCSKCSMNGHQAFCYRKCKPITRHIEKLYSSKLWECTGGFYNHIVDWLNHFNCMIMRMGNRTLGGWVAQFMAYLGYYKLPSWLLSRCQFEYNVYNSLEEEEVEYQRQRLYHKLIRREFGISPLTQELSHKFMECAYSEESFGSGSLKK